MDELKRCGGYKGHWACEGEYPDHMIPVSEFHVSPSRHDGYQPRCFQCNTYYTHNGRPKHPITGQFKMNWKSAKAFELGGDAKNRNTPEWKSYLDKAEILWGFEIKGAILKSGMGELKKYAGEEGGGLGAPNALLKFKSKKPKFNQGQYGSSPSTPRDSTKEVVPKEGPGYVYVMIDTLKMPGLIKIGTAENVGDRLQDGNTWGAFSCLYKKAFERSYEAESKVHELLDDCRVYSNKEWFSVDTDLAIKTIEDLYELS
jgi:hypothetical protein